ncbi:hypothetical protein D3C74_179160 [compost metagenome]
MNRAGIAAALGAAVADEVLQRGCHAVLSVQAFPLQAFDRSHGHFADQIGVFAKAFFGPAPAGITHDIEDRGIGDRAALAARLPGHCPAHLAIQLHVPGTAERQWHRKDRGADRHMAVRALFPDQDRDAEARVLDGITLDFVDRLCTLARRQASFQRHACPRIGA